MRLFAALLLLACSASASDEPPVPMITVTVAEFTAMKARNDEMWSDNFVLSREVQRLTTLTDEQARLVASLCGKLIKL